MRVGIILHGPEIIDEGSAERIIRIFKMRHEVIARLGGTMGRTAVLDSGLENVIDISQGLTPSETIIALGDSIGLAILLNNGKTLETGRYFGRIVASKLESHSRPPFVHIESPDNSGRIIYYWPETRRCAVYVKKILAKHYKDYDLPIERGIPLPPHVRIEGDLLIRRICGASPGENIRLDGIVIGTVINPEPEIVCKDGRVVDVRGINIKHHGLEKLANRKIDLSNAKIKTGNIRRTLHKPLMKKAEGGISSETVAIIDHCAESTFELVKDAGLVITVGDDTTAIAADILVRFGIPVIGITDGDIDNVLENSAMPAGSVIIRVRAGFDDIVGKEVFEKILGGKQKIHMPGNDILLRILTLAKENLIGAKYY
ncbi:MAG: DUF2117 domain-containing protein [Candidatus Methanoperedens sp.]|nr:DUF2117 domain-containing protein [Candidatus Methanoperedens sp.]